MPRKLHLLVCLALALGASCLAEEKNEPAAIGYIWVVAGAWEQNGKAIEPGAAVFAGATIVRRTGDKFPEPQIVIHLANGQREERIYKRPAELATPIRLPATLAPAESAFAPWARAVIGLMTREHERFVPTYTRVAGGALLREAVVVAGAGETAGPVFATLAPGEYFLRWRKIAGAGSPATSPELIALSWRANSHAGLALPSPGLYRLNLFDAQQKSLGVDAWVLACRAEEFAAASKAFTAAEEIARGWSAPPEEVRAFLRAALEEFSARPPKS